MSGSPKPTRPHPESRRQNNAASADAPYSTRALEDARLGYVSPYPPLQPTSAPSTTGQIGPTRLVSRTRPVVSQELDESVREFEFPSSTSTERRSYQLFKSIYDAEAFTQVQKEELIIALNEHRINTIGELRRIERISEEGESSNLSRPMASAWLHYVNSNNLLAELRTLTRNYPFSSECLDEAKRRVRQDPASNRSLNYCWLVLAKIHTDGLIRIYAQIEARRPVMWGGRAPPNGEVVDQLALAFIREWTVALRRFLAYWETAPIAP